MKSEPIPINELDVIGYADVLVSGKGPAVVAPVFRHRAETERCFLPPFRLAGNWLIEPQCISFEEVQVLVREERVTLLSDFQHSALPDYQLWVNEKGETHYEPTADAKRKLQIIHCQFLDAACASLRGGDLDAARQYAGIALAANDRALEPRALIAAWHALRGEVPSAQFMRKSAEQAGLNPESFSLVVKNYIESIPPEAWEKEKFDLERTLDVCSHIGAEIWVPFRFTEEEYQRFLPILHQFHRSGDEREFIVSCTGVEAVLMSERETLRIAYDNALAYIQKVQKTNVLAVAAETMLHGTEEIVYAGKRNSAVVQKLGGLLRNQLRKNVVGVDYAHD